ncbi:MAG: hypothetical protein HY828_08705 [Actinobacteria bacterium]|nr:hypothetical protein [Actinomycetota bacterium]
MTQLASRISVRDRGIAAPSRPLPHTPVFSNTHLKETHIMWSSNHTHLYRQLTHDRHEQLRRQRDRSRLRRHVVPDRSSARAVRRTP